jgi:2-phospho-L-lactate transferase/gluconeogenesis factor (CofD/UPF0052 family)
VATLLVPGISRALAATKATRVYVCNARMQKGETQGFDAAAHVAALLDHLPPSSLDVVVVQSPRQDNDGVGVDRAALEAFGVEVVAADVAAPTTGHDAHRLGAVLSSVV